MKGVLITGTDTGVGKTLVGCGLAAVLNAQGKTVGVMKPCETGCALRDGDLYPEDAARLAAFARTTLTLERVCPYRFTPPVAPSVAAAMSGTAIDPEQLITVCHAIAAQSDFVLVEGAVRTIKAEFPHLEICLSLGIMNEEQARILKAAGVGWINHNLNTSRRFHPEICTTHTYEDRINTVQNVKRAGLSTCSGGIIGMGETDDDIVELAYAVRALEIDSVPVNFLHPIEGTPLGKRRDFSPARGLKTLCLMRFLNPRSEVRMAAGRELYLSGWSGLVLYPANSIFVEGYLTTPGQQARDAHRLVEDAGFEVEQVEMQAAAL